MRRPARTQAEPFYDVPGPRTRRVTLVASIVASVAIVAGAYLWVYLPLQRNGQFTMRKWGPLVDPDNPAFDLLWNRIWQGLQNTLIAAVLAIVASLAVGTALGVLRVQLQSLRRRRYVGLPPAAAAVLRALTWGLNAITRVCVEVLRGLPVIITIFFVGRVMPEFGIDLPTLWYVVIGLTLYNGIVIAEILRSGMTGLPPGQAEAAAAAGFSPMQTTRLILLPQAYRIMLPALISQTVVILKDTSLGFLLGFDELLNVATQAVAVLNNPIQLYFAVGVIFIAVNYSLSKLAEYTQRRLARAPRVAAPPSTTAPGTQFATEAVVGTST